MTENFPNMVKEKDTRVPEFQRVPNKLDTKTPTPRHIIIKMARLKDKEKILKATREKQVLTYKGAPRGIQPFGDTGPHWKKSCLRPHITYTNTNEN